MNFLVDTHSHIYYNEYKHDLSDIISDAEQNGVERIICVGTDIKTSYESIRIANKYNNIFCTVGCHPHDSSKMKDGYIYELEEMCKDQKVVGIGETGLDYFYNHSPKEIQKKSFIDHIELSKEVNLPLVIHNRDSDKDLMQILKKYKPNGVIHCFSGDLKMAKEVISLGLMISFTGIVTFKNFTSIDVIKEINLKDFMVETDSPYLAPTPFRGKRNEPKHVKIIAERIAEIKNISVENVIKETTKNAYKLFHRLK
mgnify:CR=1 FL=1